MIEQLTQIDTEPINDENSLLLKSVIARQRNVIPFLIHPFYNSYLYAEPQLLLHFARSPVVDSEFVQKLVEQFFHPNQSSSERVAGMRNTSARYLSRIFTWLNSNHFEVIGLAEEDAYIDMTIQVIRTQGYKGEIVSYLTEEGFPTPLLIDYQFLSKYLMDLDVQHLMFGGQLGIYQQDNVLVDINPLEVDKIQFQTLFDEQRLDAFVENFGANCVAHFIKGVVEGVEQEMKRQQLTHSPIRTLIPSIMSQ